MDAYDMIKWREMHFGHDRQTAARRMGIARNSLVAYEEGKRIPPYIPLVCAAIAANLPGWELPPHMRKEKRDNPVAEPVIPMGRPRTKAGKPRRARAPKAANEQPPRLESA